MEVVCWSVDYFGVSVLLIEYDMSVLEVIGGYVFVLY